MDHVIDAKKQKIGRLASQIAKLLQGKEKATYNPRLEGDNQITIKNIKEIEIGGRKADQKIYYHHTGYMGHLKEKTFKNEFAKDPAKVLRHAVAGMLPKNRLQAKRLKRLIIEK